MSDAQPMRLVVRRRIMATPMRLFDAWTNPDQLQAWWGPPGVHCLSADIDARVGGSYRIDNQLPDGRVVRITGRFLAVEPPHRLSFTWQTEPATPGSGPERVIVEFMPSGAATEIVVHHQQIPHADRRDEHEAGWLGCLAGLAVYLGGATPAAP